MNKNKEHPWQDANIKKGRGSDKRKSEKIKQKISKSNKRMKDKKHFFGNWYEEHTHSNSHSLSLSLSLYLCQCLILTPTSQLLSSTLTTFCNLLFSCSFVTEKPTFCFSISQIVVQHVKVFSLKFLIGAFYAAKVLHSKSIPLH